VSATELPEGIPEKIEWAKCKGCGKRVLFASVVIDDDKTRLVPLDPVPPIYHVVWESGKSALARRATRNRVMVSHFATCPKANDFSGGKKK
jgi:hypothetical protein